MLKPIDKKQAQLIIKNIIKACKDISKLNNTGYKFIINCSGFIAHYDLQGFIQNYQCESLKSHILHFRNQNQWANFRIGEPNAEYYHSKRDIYNEILKSL